MFGQENMAMLLGTDDVVRQRSKLRY